jgi:hypothetical protein
MRRAARWDGVIPGKLGSTLSPEEWRDILAYIKQHRTATTPFDAAFDAVHGGPTPGDDPARAKDIVAPYVDAGLTWWVETVDPWRFGLKWEDPLPPDVFQRMRERVLQGPPRL